MLSSEEWLNKNIKDDDWNKLKESLNDALWTNNVIRYMKGYAEYIVQQSLSCSADASPKSCPKCASLSIFPLTWKWGRKADGTTYTMYRCKDCGHDF